MYVVTESHVCVHVYRHGASIFCFSVTRACARVVYGAYLQGRVALVCVHRKDERARPAPSPTHNSATLNRRVSVDYA